MQGYSGFCKATSARYSGRQGSSPRHRRGWFYCQCEAVLYAPALKRACRHARRNFKSAAPVFYVFLHHSGYDSASVRASQIAPLQGVSTLPKGHVPKDQFHGLPSPIRFSRTRRACLRRFANSRLAFGENGPLGGRGARRRRRIRWSPPAGRRRRYPSSERPRAFSPRRKSAAICPTIPPEQKRDYLINPYLVDVIVLSQAAEMQKLGDRPDVSATSPSITTAS